MFAKIITISCLVAAVSCANFPRGPHAAPSQAHPQAVAAPGPAAEAAAKAAAHQAKLHYVEIGPSLKGDYKFGYDTGSGPSGQSFREETRLDDGTVKGAYGYVDANGKQRIVKYTAGKNGFVVENDQEAPGQGANAAANAPAQAPEPVRRPQPVAAPQPQTHAQPQAQPQPQAFSEQPNFDDATPLANSRVPVPTPEDRARAEQQHAEQLRQHQLAQQAALAQQQQFAQRLQMQQQQELAAEQARRNHQAPQPNHQLQSGAHGSQNLHHQQLQAPSHQHIDPQTGSFFSSSTNPNLQQLLNNQLRQLQSGSQFSGQFQPPQAPQQLPQFPTTPTAFQQPAQQFSMPQQPPQDFNQFRAARQAANLAPFHQAQSQAQPHHGPAPQSALLALHQQQQHDAQLLANLRAQQLARAQEQQARQAAQPAQQQGPPQFSSVLEAPQQLRPHHQQQFAAPAQQFQRAPPSQPQQPHPSASAPVSAQPVTPQPENFGPPVIDIRTLNYSIGQQTRV